MSAFSILAPDASNDNFDTCKIAGCQLDQHDELAPTLHEGVTKYDKTWTVTACLDEDDGKGWEVDTFSTYQSELTPAEARAYAEALMMIAQWCEIANNSKAVAA